MKKIPIIDSLEEHEKGVFIERLQDLIVEEYTPAELVAPHRHPYFTCLLVEKGSVECRIDFQKITIGRNDILVLTPGQVHELVKSTPLTGWYTYFDIHLLNNQVRSILEQSLSEVILLHLTPGEAGWFRNVLILLADSIQSTKEISLSARNALAQSFIFQMAHLYQAQEKNIS